MHHDEKGKDGVGSEDMSGAGPAEWGRVLISAERESARTDHAAKATDVVITLAVKGGEIADQEIRVHRRIWADDPEDLNAPLHLTVSATDPTDTDPTDTDAAST